jgi:hypothetical protein
MKKKLLFNTKMVLISIFILCVFSTETYAQIIEGNLYRENSSPEVYVINGNKKIWIPTPDALLAMGHQWSDVNIVADAALNNFERFNIKSASATPGSILFLMPEHYPITINTSQNIKGPLLQGNIELITIHGWLKENVTIGAAPAVIGRGESPGSDINFEFIPDYKWLYENNIDINKLIMVGNIAAHGDRYIFEDSTCNKYVSTNPAIHCEINSWKWRGRIPANLNHPPADWINIPDIDGAPLYWPFNPNFSAGQYVSVSGSLVKDTPHGYDFPQWMDKSTTQIPKETDKWCPGWPWACQVDATNFARWTEIHPVDSIKLIDTRQQTETTYGLLLTSNVGDCNSISVNLSPDPSIARPPNSVVAFREIIGAEWLDPNKNNLIKPPFYSPQFIRADKFTDHITVTANTCGNGTTSHGRIKALYSIWWVPAQRVPHEMNVTVNPFPISLNTSTTFTITASDIDIGTPVIAEIFYNNMRIGLTNSSITYAFRPVRTKHVIIERDGRGKPHRTIEYINSYPPLEIRIPEYKRVTKRLF